MTDLPNLKFEGPDDDKDVLPGERVVAVESGIYDVKIVLAYLEQAKSGAWAMKLVLKETPFENMDFNFTVYITSGKAKGMLNYYVDPEGRKRKLPGFALMDSLSQVTVGQSLSDLEPEEKIISIYDFETKGKVDAPRQVYTELLGKEFKAGILKIEDNKKVQIDNEWKTTAERRTFNELERCFDEKGFTVTERRAQETEATFIHDWNKKYAGQTVNRYKAPEVKSESSVKSDKPKPTTSLFN
jgi:hypothetical protein